MRAAPAPLFVLSFRQRDELAALAAGAGWLVVAARRAGGAERRFLTSGAALAVVDTRGAAADGIAAVQALGATVEANGGALLALVSRGEHATVAALYESGATHFLASPFSEAEFLHALDFAARHAERMAREWQAGEVAAPLGWRYDLATRSLVLTPALASRLDLDEQPGIGALLRHLDATERVVALAALRRLSAERSATAFAHDSARFGRIVQHVQLDVSQGLLNAVVEPLGRPPEPAAELREALAGARDAGSARRWLARQLDRTGDAGHPLHAMLVALNRFEMVNTAYGRVAGDALLRSAQKRIEEAAAGAVGRDALVARMGGATFLVAASAPRAAVGLAAERLAGALARPFVTGESIAVLGCRIGLAEAHSGDDAAMLLRRASEALAEARESDSATVRVAEDGDAPLDRLAVELHHAIEQGHIAVLFQPQVSVVTGRIVGVEALARWDHAVLGTIGADTLFAAAARADLEIALSDHIQRLTLARAAAWPAALRDLRLALNLTAADIARPGFADLFLDRVDASGFPRARLTLEITESGLIEDLGIASALLSVLRSAGCRVAIDDFGTGYSSLAYLKALPLDYLKIDKQLAQDITGSPRDRVVVRGVIDMARSLGLTVIAEGVETDAQLEALAKVGCQIYQGFLRAGALDVAALTALVHAG